MPNPTTTDLIPFKDIADGIVLLKDGSVRAIVEVNAINFELRSSDEQTAILQQFQGFLNSLDFPVQFVVQSRKFDITAYLATVQTAADQLTNDLLKVQAQEYSRFVGELAELANIMAKKFYIALPFMAVSASQSKGFFGSITGIFSKKPAAPQGIPADQLATYKSQVSQRAYLVIAGISGLGLQGRLLGQEEVVALFTSLYSPVVPAAKQNS